MLPVFPVVYPPTKNQCGTMFAEPTRKLLVTKVMALMMSEMNTI
jgi:hypothetical protein